jgi:hypothetical protein
MTPESVRPVRAMSELSIGPLNHCYSEVQRINDDSRERLSGSDDEAIPATYGLLGFPSSPPSAPRSRE